MMFSMGIRIEKYYDKPLSEYRYTVRVDELLSDGSRWVLKYYIGVSVAAIISHEDKLGHTQGNTELWKKYPINRQSR